MLLSKNNTLAKKLAFLIILCSSVITCIAIGITLLKQYNDDVNNLSDRIHSVEVISVSALEKSLWEFNDEQVMVIIESILELEDVVYVEVSATHWDGSQYLVSTQENFSEDVGLMSVTLNLLAPATVNAKHNPPEKLGELRVVASLDNIYLRLWQQAGFIIATHGIKTLIITFIILWLLRRLFTRHLQYIAEYTHQLSLAESQAALTLQRTTAHSKDELDEVVIAINFMRENLLLEKEKQLKSMQQKIQAEANSRAKTDFIATMSHEIRTPMNGILGMLDVIEGENLPEQQRGYLDIARQSGETLLNIINDILDFSKIEAGKMALNETPFQLQDLIQQSCHLYESKAKDKGITIAFTVGKQVPAAVVGDGVRLRQVLLNLISNAVKFTDQGKVEVFVDVVAPLDVKGSQCTLRFRVQDSGCGINDRDKASLFQAFEQGDNGRLKGRSGTGLGLAICKKIILLMQGSIGVNSTLGTGSEFWFELTLAISSQKFQPAIPEANIIHERDYSGLNVLVADDNAVNREVIAALLNRCAISATLVNDGQQALDTFIAENGDFDLILMDCEMPGMDGYEAAALIRNWQKSQTGEQKPVYITALTAHNTVYHRDKSLAAGMDDYLTKPIKLLSLKDFLQKITR